MKILPGYEKYTYTYLRGTDALCRYANWQDIEVGSTEQFQGREKRIILISTVRSQVELLKEDFKFNLGFLDNPKRFFFFLLRRIFSKNLFSVEFLHQSMKFYSRF
jgi:helicase MOV-10